MKDDRKVVQRLQECPKIIWYAGDLLSDALHYITELQKVERVDEVDRELFLRAQNLLLDAQREEDAGRKSAILSEVSAVLWKSVWPKVRGA